MHLDGSSLPEANAKLALAEDLLSPSHLLGRRRTSLRHPGLASKYSARLQRARLVAEATRAVIAVTAGTARSLRRLGFQPRSASSSYSDSWGLAHLLKHRGAQRRIMADANGRTSKSSIPQMNFVQSLVVLVQGAFRLVAWNLCYRQMAKLKVICTSLLRSCMDSILAPENPRSFLKQLQNPKPTTISAAEMLKNQRLHPPPLSLHVLGKHSASIGSAPEVPVLPALAFRGSQVWQICRNRKALLPCLVWSGRTWWLCASIWPAWTRNSDNLLQQS